MKNRFWGNRRPRLSASGAPGVMVLFMALAALTLLASPAARADDYYACWDKTWDANFTHTWIFTHVPATYKDYIWAKSTVDNTSPMAPGESSCWGGEVISWGPGLGFKNTSTTGAVGKPSNIKFTEMRIKLYNDTPALVKTETIPAGDFGSWFTVTGSDFSNGPHTAKNWWDQGDSGAG